MDVVVVSGLSGAGKSTALNALEDVGYFCVDNLPAPVMASTLAALRESGHHKVALSLDVRGRSFLDGSVALLDRVAETMAVQVLFLDAPDELLARRFSTTRRPHPLSTEKTKEVRAVLDGIVLERNLLAPLRGRATACIDTADTTVHDLRRRVIEMFSPKLNARRMLIRVVSFGFKFGVPTDTDLMLDVRFLPNPFFVPELRPLSGKDDLVARFVLQNPDAQGFLDHALPLLLYCIPRFEKEGKSYVSIAVGCTGGRHRSVALSTTLAQLLSEKLGTLVEASHRDVERAE